MLHEPKRERLTTNDGTPELIKEDEVSSNDAIVSKKNFRLLSLDGWAVALALAAALLVRLGVVKHIPW